MTEVAAPMMKLSLTGTSLKEARQSLRDISNGHRRSTSSSTTTSSSVSSVVKSNDDSVMVHDLLAALAFSPRSVVDFPPSVVPLATTPKEVPARANDENQPQPLMSTKKQSSFESPLPRKKSINDSAASRKLVVTPWVRPQPTTPPTAKLEDEEEEEEEDEQTERGPSPTQKPTTMSPVRSLRSSSSNNSNAADAVAMAYPLCLPAEFLRTSGASKFTPTDKQGGPTKHVITGKPCKRFPKVDTNIAAVGVQRSSAVLATSKSLHPKFSPFARIQNNSQDTIGAVDSKGRPLFLRRNNSKDKNGNVAHHVYEHAKGAWGWGRNHATLVSPLMGLAEGMLSKVADMTTGNGDLEHVDHEMVEPVVLALDQHVLNPVLGTIGGFFSGFFGGNKEEEKANE